ncbi:MAG: hypothetical protein K5695_18065, partial [Oscillospiraceae bacterium]|nr:hypothetical protein [Oscillospiraceae bacterium]
AETEGAITQARFNVRASLMAKMIPADVRSLMDIGCGVCDLKKYIPAEIRYYGLDVCKRDEETLVCDLNCEPLPDVPVDLYYMAGLIYYINEPEKLLSQMQNAKYILFDYGGIERYLRLDGVPGDPLIHARNNFVSPETLFQALRKNGFILENVHWDWQNYTIGWHMYLFKKI